MNSTLDIIAFNTVPDGYSWDDGNPSQETLSPLSGFFSEGAYVGMAPFAAVLLSSTCVADPSSVGIRRTIDFGDLYNPQNNVQFYTLTGVTHFSHTYLMPGVYTITLTEEEYVAIPNPIKIPPASYFHSSSDNRSKRQTEAPVYLHWEDYKSDIGSNTNRKKLGQPITWENLSFQEPLTFEFPQQIKWSDAKFCIKLLPSIHWLWDNLFCTASPANEYSSPVTWNQAMGGQRHAKTWNAVLSTCAFDDFILSARKIVSVVKQSVVKVLEKTPTAYLSAAQPPYPVRKSPLTITLTPRYTQTGSFPIEKIVWDLGDGSPLLVRRRNDKKLTAPFVYTEALTADFKDPRNFDIVHTYKSNFREQNTFYPTISVFSSSTGSCDIAAITIGPLKTQDLSSVDFILTQNELTENGAVLLGEVNNVAALWRTNN